MDGEQNEVFEPALKSIESILKLGEQNEDSNPYAFGIKECGGLDKIECLKSHQNENISQKAALIVETFFVPEKGTNSIPQVIIIFYKYCAFIFTCGLHFFKFRSKACKFRSNQKVKPNNPEDGFLF